jgi:flagellum-specific ATP synthase
VNLIDFRAVGRLIESTQLAPVKGRVARVRGTVVEALLPNVRIGTQVTIDLDGGREVAGEVVGFSGRVALLMPLGEIDGLREGAFVTPMSGETQLPVGDALLGRVLDASLAPVDGKPAPIVDDRTPLSARAPNAMTRRRIHEPVETGVRAIDALLTVGRGQRIGVFAGPGVGKSSLLGMLAKGADADVIVTGLVGERGREVREFVERDLGSALARSVVVVSTSDEPALRRVRAAAAATAVAEHFRRRGKRVLFLLDSLTRVAMAQREIGLAAGEPPTARGYTPSVFALLPRLLERAGNDEGQGSITAVYTVLAEGDDLTDPIVDTSRSILDGHIVLSRALAESGHFPAIDVLGSVSRVMPDVTTVEHRSLARSARESLAALREVQDLLDVGAYVPGSNPRVDRALRARAALASFLKQDAQERATSAVAMTQLAGILAAAERAPKEERK